MEELGQTTKTEFKSWRADDKLQDRVTIIVIQKRIGLVTL